MILTKNHEFSIGIQAARSITKIFLKCFFCRTEHYKNIFEVFFLSHGALQKHFWSVFSARTEHYKNIFEAFLTPYPLSVYFFSAHATEGNNHLNSAQDYIKTFSRQKIVFNHDV